RNPPVSLLNPPALLFSTLRSAPTSRSPVESRTTPEITPTSLDACADIEDVGSSSAAESAIAMAPTRKRAAASLGSLPLAGRYFGYWRIAPSGTELRGGICAHYTMQAPAPRARICPFL